MDKFVKTVEYYIDQMHEIIGKLSFFLHEDFPINDMFESARRRFQKGVMNGVESSCKDVKRLYNEYKNCTNSRGIIIVRILNIHFRIGIMISQTFIIFAKMSSYSKIMFLASNMSLYCCRLQFHRFFVQSKISFRCFATITRK